MALRQPWWFIIYRRNPIVTKPSSSRLRLLRTIEETARLEHIVNELFFFLFYVFSGLYLVFILIRYFISIIKMGCTASKSFFFFVYISVRRVGKGSQNFSKFSIIRQIINDPTKTITYSDNKMFDLKKLGMSNQ